MFVFYEIFGNIYTIHEFRKKRIQILMKKKKMEKQAMHWFSSKMG